MPSVICGNTLLADRFKCPFDPKHLACKKIDWWICRDYQNNNHAETSTIDTLVGASQ
jgi:hypothetical protein